MIPPSVGQRIKQARKEGKLTQTQLAKRCAVTRSCVSQWETGAIKKISAEQLNAAAKALHVSIDWILTGAAHAPLAVGIAEQAPAYQLTDEHILAELWPRLTHAQRREILLRAQALADQNAHVLAELGGQ